MMTDTLRALGRDRLVRRRIPAEVPLRVEYSLTPLGWAITDPLMSLAEWHKSHGDEDGTRAAATAFGDGGEIAQRAARRRAADAAAARPRAALR